MSRLKSQAGYTLIEVMTAVAIMIVASTGIAVMVNATSHANEDAWETSVATQIAATWVERIKRQSMLWTTPGAPPPQATYLSQPADTWFVPQDVTMPEEAAQADGSGWSPPVGPIRFCVNLKNVPLYANTVRVDVRVFWNRSARGDAMVVNRALGPIASGCTVPLTDAQEQDQRIRVLYFSYVARYVSPAP